MINWTTKTVKPTKAECVKVLRLLRKQRGIKASDSYGPQLIMDWDWLGHGAWPSIVWEGGPYDWAMYMPHGGMDPEFGTRMQDMSADMPAGLWIEPMTSWAVSIYKDVPA